MRSRFVLHSSPLFQVLSLQQRIDIRNYVLTYLYGRPKLAAFVAQGLVTLFARITKLGWFDTKEDEYVFRKAIEDVTKFLQVRMENIVDCVASNQQGIAQNRYLNNVQYSKTTYDQSKNARLLISRVAPTTA